jgi:pimeloyl-ACP methyl ester carboxylesterase
MTDPTFLLIHGAWGGAWCWRDLTIELDGRGAKWVAVDLPSSMVGADPATNLADDAAEVALVAPRDSPVVLVAHSYGGAVLTEVAPQIVNLQRTVYIAALVPNFGQSATDTSRELRTRTLLDDAIEVEGEFLFINSELAKAALYHDCEPDLALWATSRLSTQTIASFRSARSSPDVAVASRYIRCSKDQAIDPSLQELVASRCNEAVSIDSGHSPFFSQPQRLADLILQ